MQKLACQACGAALPAPAVGQESIVCPYCGYNYLLPNRPSANPTPQQVAAYATALQEQQNAAKYSLICGVLAFLLVPIVPAVIGIYLTWKQRPRPFGFWLCAGNIIFYTIALVCFGVVSVATRFS